MVASKTATGTSSTSSSRESGNTKQIPPGRYWGFTLNNFTLEEADEIRAVDPRIVPNLRFQHEIGKCGTNHLQGAIDVGYKKKIRPFALGLTNRISWKKPTGSPQDCCEYAFKGDSQCKTVASFYYTRGFEYLFKPKYDVFEEEMNGKYYDWQEPIIDKLKTKPNNRTIDWIVGRQCNEGKTIFQKHIIQTFEGVIQTGGCAHDMKNGVIEYMKKNNNETPKIVLMNIPKTQDSHYVSYQGIEQIKDMCFFSGKYESGQVLGRSPHICVFANEPPNLEGVDPNRWNITYLE